MVFTSIPFFVLFTVTYLLILLFNIPLVRKKLSEKTQLLLKHSILLIASYVFYGWWDYRFCFLMFLLTLVAWLCSKKIYENKNKKLFSVIGIVFPLVILGFFKYFNFFIDSFTILFGIESSAVLNIILPVGISFYTFQSMSYTIDVLKGTISSHSLFDVALYISFFPQLVAGPIVKACDFLPQLKNNAPLKLNNLVTGLQIFMFGMFKKIVIADNLSVFVDDVFSKPVAFSSLTVILAIVSYSIQIYCDFSGYSDMAVGIAKCFGYDFLANFNIPYISKNVTEFWKRWHISLSSWLQQYLYIPLGGNRKGKVRTYINLLLTMVLGGLWHGANYTFIFWGLLHGLALCVHKVYLKFKKGNHQTKIGSAVSIFITYVFVCICWVFFRADNFTTAIDVLKKMFIWSGGITQVFSWSIFGIAILLIAIIAATIKSKKSNEKSVNGFYPILNLNKISGLIIFIVEIMIIVMLAYTKSNPFIYFQS